MSYLDLLDEREGWGAKFNPPPASFTADMDDEGGANAVIGGYLDID